MKTLSCKDISSDIDCDYEATGESAKEVVGKVMAHAKAEHPDTLAGMSDSDIRSMMEDKVHA